MDIEIKQNHTHETWSGNLDDFNYSLFIAPAWVESLKDDNKQVLYLDFFSNGELIAKIAGFIVESKFPWQRKLLFYAGPAIRRILPAGTIDQCILSLVKFAKINNYPRVVILSYDYKYVLPYGKDLGFSERSEFIVDLLQDKEIIVKNISRAVKRKTRNAIKNGFIVTETNSIELLNHLVLLMQETKLIRLSKGYSDYNYFYLPGFTQKTLENLVKAGVISFYYVEKENSIYAICAIMKYNLKAYALFVGVNALGYQNSVSSFLDYSVICSLRDNNYEYLNFGGVPIDKTHKGLVQFKKSLGAAEYFSSYGSTNFLTFPYFLLNPLVKRIRKIQANFLLNYLKRVFNS